MADVKISELTPKGSAVATNDLFETSVAGTTTKSVSGQNLVDLVGADNLASTANDATARTNIGAQAQSAVLDNTTASFTTADETKLDGIEASADVTDTANVTSAGAAMLTGADFTGDISTAAGRKVTTNTIDETTAASGVTIDGVLLIDNRIDAAQGTFDGAGGYIPPVSGTGTIAATPADGCRIAGWGSNNDVEILNNNNVTVMNVPAGSLDAHFQGTVDANTVYFDNLRGTGSVAVTDILDEDNMASDSATKLATQQSIKAYVDASGGAPEGSAVLSTGETGTSKFLRIDGDGTSSWQVPPTGDITAVIAGTGISGGGTSGDVTITNSAPNIVQTTVTGNAGTATTLQTARTIAGVSFDGSANISLNNNAITNGAGYTTNTGDITGVTAGTGISGGGTSGTVTITNSSPNATHTGEVTGSGALTIADNVVDEANLKVSNAPTNGYMLTAQSGNTGGLTWAAAAAGGGMVWSVKTTTYTAATDEAIIANTSGGIWTLTLPATPVVGDVVRVADGASWETNNLTVARNGSTIEGVAQDLTMDINSASVDFVYDGTTWQVYVSMGTELVDYLPLAGGTLTGDLQVKGVRETVIALSGTTPAIDPTAGTIATWTLSGASTPTFGAGWAEGESILLMIDDGAGNTITWPTMQWAGGTAPTLPTTGYAVVTLFKVGATFYGTSAGDMS